MMLMLAWNDPKNGHTTGHCDGIEIFASPKKHDSLLHLCGPAWICKYIPPWLQLGRIKLFTSDYRSWVGNWCWDAVAGVPASDVGTLLAALQRSVSWDVEEGETRLYEAWRGNQRTAEQWAGLLEEASSSSTCAMPK